MYFCVEILYVYNKNYNYINGFERLKKVLITKKHF